MTPETTPYWEDLIHVSYFHNPLGLVAVRKAYARPTGRAEDDWGLQVWNPEEKRTFISREEAKAAVEILYSDLCRLAYRPNISTATRPAEGGT